MQGDEGDFGGAVDTYGCGAANAFVYIERLACRVVIMSRMVVPAGGFMEHKVGERVSEESYLSGMGVPAEG